MNDLPKLYFTLESYLFPMLEEEIGELTAKMKEFLRIVELEKRPGSSPTYYVGADWDVR